MSKLREFYQSALPASRGSNAPTSVQAEPPVSAPSRQTLARRPAREPANGTPDVTVTAEEEPQPTETETDEPIPDELLAHPEDDMRPDADAIRNSGIRRSGDQRGVFTEPGAVGVRSRRGGRPALGHANNQAQVSVGTELEPEVELSRARQSMDPNNPLGPPRTDTTSATVGLDSVGVQHQRRTGEGDSARTTTVGGQATFDPSEGITGMQVTGSQTFPGGRKVSTSFGYEVDIGQPTLEDGRWKVEGEFTWTGSFGEAVSRGSERTAGASIRVGQKRSFVRWFNVEADARSFRDNYRTWLGPRSFQDFSSVESADAAERMAVGDERSTTTTAGASVSGSVELAGVEVGATFSASSSREFVVTRSSSTAVALKVRDIGELGGGGSAGVGALANMGVTGTDGDLSGREVEFALPAGRTALDQALQTRRLPTGRAGTGWRETQRSEGDRDQTRTDVGVLGVTIQSTETVDDEQVTDEHGTRRRVTGTADDRAGTVLPSWMTDDTPLEEASQRTQFTSDQREGSALSVRVDGSDARDTRNMLARAAGVGAGGDTPDSEDSGEWTLSSRLSDDELRAFLRAVHSGRFDRSALGTAASEGLTLMEAVRSAGNLDDARAAVARFLASTRTRGMAMIRAVLRNATGQEAPPMDVALQGSQVWEGEAGRCRVTSRIEELEQRLEQGDDLERLEPDVEQLYREQADRVQAMRSEGQNEDLPADLRARQIALNQPLLERLDALRRRVREAVRSARARSEPDRATALRDAAGTADQAESSVDGHEAEQEVARRSSNALQALAGDERRMYEKREAMNRLRTAVLAERGVHSGAAKKHFSRPALEALPNPFNDFRAMYRTAVQQEQAGQAAVALARQTIQAFEAERRQVPSNGVLDATAAGLVDELRQLAWRGHDELERARAAFAAALQAYGRIRAAVPADERRGYFGETQVPSA